MLEHFNLKCGRFSSEAGASSLKWSAFHFFLKTRSGELKRLCAELHAFSLAGKQSSRKSGASSSEPEFTTLKAWSIQLNAGCVVLKARRFQPRAQ
jgi:hypothetical protein